MSYRDVCDRLAAVVAQTPGRVLALKVTAAELEALWPVDVPLVIRPGHRWMWKNYPLRVVPRRAA